jgi:hypothetical protein
MAEEFQMRVAELPPERPRRKKGTLLEEVVAFVTARPGQWCEVRRGKPSTVGAWACRTGKSPSAAGCEFTTRLNHDGTMSAYCRYTPKD